MQDLANVEAGIYPVPADHDGFLLTLIHRSLLLFEDLPKIHRRRERRAYHEVLSHGTRGTQRHDLRERDGGASDPLSSHPNFSRALRAVSGLGVLAGGNWSRQ
jgi:hypothetical protein